MPTYLWINQIEENRAQERSKIQYMSDSTDSDLTDSIASENSQSTAPLRRTSRAGPANNIRAKRHQTEAARRVRAANLSATAAAERERDDEWRMHEISQPSYRRPDDAEVLYNAAIMISDSDCRNKIKLAKLCNVRIEAVKKAIKFIRIQESRYHLPENHLEQDLFRRDKEIYDDFIIWHKFACKEGPKMLDPLIMLRIQKMVIYQVQIQQNCTCTKSCKDFIKSIVSPAIREEKIAGALNSLIQDEGALLPKRTQYRLWTLFCRESITTSGKKSIKSRKDAAKNPLGGLSLAAGWPWLVNKLKVHPKCIVFVDAMAHLANHSTGKLGFVKGKLPAGTKKLMRDEGWTCVYDRADAAAERCFSVDVLMAYGAGLLMWTVHIYDMTINDISIVRVSKVGFVMFEPYSQATKDAVENTLQPAQRDQIPQHVSVPPESLAKQVADRWTADILVPTLKAHRTALQAEAVECGMDPAIYQVILSIADGESTHLNALLDNHVKILAEDDCHCAKGPGGLSNKYAVPDVAKSFPLMHGEYISGMNDATDADIEVKISAEPGLRNAITKLMSTKMSSAHKETFRRLLALTPSLVAAAVTPGIVNKAFEVSALWPVNDVNILARCWPDFKTLSEHDAQAVMKCVRGPLTEIFEECGMLEPSKCKTRLNEDVPAVTFPDNLIDDDCVLNRHGFLCLSYPYVLDKYESRVLHDSAVAIQRQIVRETKAVKEKKAAIRMGHCMIAQPSQETNFKIQCRCGGVAFSTDKFASHEKSKKHTTMFGEHDWGALYLAAGLNSGSGHVDADVAAALDGDGDIADIDE